MALSVVIPKQCGKKASTELVFDKGAPEKPISTYYYHKTSQTQLLQTENAYMSQLKLSGSIYFTGIGERCC